nr:DUF1775 domain-containing protein [Streptomyces sp. GC420]
MDRQDGEAEPGAAAGPRWEEDRQGRLADHLDRRRDPPREFHEFDVSVGPLPEDGDRMVFKALQTCGTGQVVRWIEVPGKDGAEPEHPAPVLTLTPAVDEAAAPAASASGDPVTAAKKPTGTEGGAAEAAARTADGREERPVSTSGDAQDGTARLLGGAGLAAVRRAGLPATLAVTRRRSGRNSGLAGW